MEGKHLPGRHAIGKFGDGGFHFGGMSHRGSLLVLPSGMSALHVSGIDEVAEGHLKGLVAEKGMIDLVLVGTGARMIHLPQALRNWLAAHGLRHDAMATPAAVSTYNILLAEGRRVAAIFIAIP